MKRSILGIAAVSAPVAFGLMLAVGASSPASSADQLAFGYGMGPGGGMGAGPMWADGDRSWGPGMGRGGRGGRAGGGWPGAYWVDADHDGTITVDEVKTFIEARHLQRGFQQFTIGEVVEKDDNTITAQILDADGDKVRVLSFPRKVDTTAVNAPAGPGNGYGMRGGARGGFHHGRGGYGYGMQRGDCGAPGYGMRGGRGGHGMRSGYGPGMNGSYGPGMRGGYGSGMRGGYGGYGMGMGYGLQADGVVTVDEVKGLLEQRLAAWRNPNLKVGEVKEKDETTITAEIVTKDGSLVQSMDFDRKTGRPMWKR